MKLKVKKKINNLDLMSRDLPIFQNVFGEQWRNLPPVMLKHYSNKPFSQDVVNVVGKMDIHYSGMIFLFLPLLKLFHILVPYKGKDIPTEVKLRSHTNNHYFYFDRTFHFPEKKPYHFCSYMMHVRENIVVEMMKFGIGWRMRYLFDNNKIKLIHNGYVWKLFGKLIPLPLDIFLGRIYLEKEAISDETFRINMKIMHPFAGEYTYCGEFNILDS